MSRAFRLSALFILAALLAVPGSGRANGPLPGPQVVGGGPVAPDSIVGRFAAAPRCTAMSDGCRVCVRGKDGFPVCSFPGFACTPTGWRCKVGAPKTIDSREPPESRRQ